MKRPETLELGIVEGQADGDDLGQQVNGSEGAVIIVDVVYVNIWVALDRRSDSLIPSRVEDSRRQVVHTSGIWVRLSLRTEDRGIKNDVGNVVQDVLLDLDEIRCSEDDDLDRLDRFARGILEVTKTTDLDLELPIDDLVLERHNKNLSSLFLSSGQPMISVCL